MAAIADITLPDGLATPVNHIFSHVSHSKDGVLFRDSTAGFTTLSAPTAELTRLPSRAKNIRRVRARIVVPILEAIVGGTSEGYVAAPRKIGAVEVVKDFIIHERATEQAVKDARAYMSILTGAALTQFTDLLYYDKAPY